MRLLHTGVLLTSVVAAACTSGAPAVPVVDIAQTRLALDSLWAAYGRAAASGDASQITAFYPDSVYLIEPDMPTLRDRAALQAIVLDAFKAGRYLEARIQPEVTEAVGDRVMQFGSYLERFEPTGQPAMTTYGRFGAVLGRDSSGAWKILRLVAAKDSTVVASAPSAR